MPEQGADAVLRYVLESGISAVELMGGPIEAYAGAPAMPRPPGGQGGPGGPGGPGGRRPPTPEEIAAREKYAAELKAWRLSQSMDKFKALRKMYNDAGVTIYATKMLSPSMSDEEFEYVFNVAEALGATHTTLELTTDSAALKRIGDYAMKRKIYAAYHTHLQGTLTAFDEAFAVSKGNMANVDFGHYVAAGSGDPVVFLEKFHDRISSFHLKDRKSKENGGANVRVGPGRHADRADPAERAEERLQDAGLDRDGVRRAGGIDAGGRSAQVRRVLPARAHLSAMSERKYRQHGYQDDDRDRARQPERDRRPAPTPGAPAATRRLSSEGARNPNLMGFHEVVKCARCGAPVDPAHPVAQHLRPMRPGAALLRAVRLLRHQRDLRVRAADPGAHLAEGRGQRLHAVCRACVVGARDVVDAGGADPESSAKKAFDDLFK